MVSFWLFTVIILIVIEGLTAGLTTIWFVFSGLISLLLASLDIANFEIQFAVFVVMGMLALLITRPLLKKIITVKKENTNLDRIIGMKGIVTKKIEVNQIGEVKVDGKLWSAYADEEIDVDSIVKVLQIKGVKIEVEKENE